MKIPLGMEVDLSPGRIVLDGAQLPPQERGTADRVFDPRPFWSNRRPSQLLLSSC